MGGLSYGPHGNPGSNMVDTQPGSAGAPAKNLKPSGAKSNASKMGGLAKGSAKKVAQRSKGKARKKIAGKPTGG